ncbi:MAG: alkaline phosphatase family protein [Gemmatimonadaceae bacterium]
MLVSVDGLRGDALRHMPRVSALLDRALWTDSMSTIVPSLTVPGHLAMFTGRDVSEFGITNNAFDNSAAATLILNNATSIFAWAHDAGMSSIALAGLSLIPPSDVAAAREFFELDSLIPVDRLVDPIIDRAIGIATRPNAPNVLFVHVPTTDFAGHDDGWTRADTLDELGHEVPTSGYVSAVASVDAALGRLWAAVSAEIATGAVALIITADHGGGDGNGCVSGVPEEREHCTGEPGDRLIPFMLLTRDVAPARLGAVASITQIAPTAAALLQLTRPASTDPSLLR